MNCWGGREHARFSPSTICTLSHIFLVRGIMFILLYIDQEAAVTAVIFCDITVTAVIMSWSLPISWFRQFIVGCRWQGLGMHWLMLHTSSFKKMALSGSQALSSLLQIVKELANSSVWPLWYALFEVGSPFIYRFNCDIFHVLNFIFAVRGL